ncbi:M48 family metallopeptidase [Caldisalinibacter kiritimatiensis]|uniref:YgjP-like metallopeptidase domain-containing protein n=1 Tax=Caldisalinibacter kiritimatiensis TaxID=1304284 RepID=R1AXA7_9FIRM|nr:SprT family zinc-dependent metalloprotease [Caldisalinibacter kiritimatiensis]EOD01838.1 hypothetical protein L21TH_0085 [Caldisalinibacter kiritimatiensis]
MKLSIQHKNRIILFTVEYRKRKTLEIRIIPPDKVLVICPKGLSKDKIIELVSKKANWIVKKLKELESIEYNLVEKKYEDGEVVKYLGEDYYLHINIVKNKNKAVIEINKDKLNITSPMKDKELVKKILKDWYKKQANKVVKERVEYYKDIIGVKPNKVKAKEQKRIWGSCTSKGNVYFNWRLIMAPIHIIDYVVVHELCHLIHMNHSKEFWKLVESVIPDYKERKEWLKKYGVTLKL